MQNAKLDHVSLNADTEQIPDVTIEVHPQGRRTFRVTVITHYDLHGIMKALTGNRRFAVGDFAGSAKITFHVSALSPQVVTAELRNMYGTYFALEAPEYYYTGNGKTVKHLSLHISDRVPGNHRYLTLYVGPGHADAYAQAINDAAKRGGIPALLEKASVELDASRVYVVFAEQPTDHLDTFLKLAFLYDI